MLLGSLGGFVGLDHVAHDPVDALGGGHGEFTALDELGETVSRMHAEGITHGDLHPENVMVERGAPGRFLFLDCMQVRRGRSRWPIVADLVNFMFYADRFAWPLKESLLERMLRAYHERGTVHFENLDGLKRTVARGVRLRTGTRAIRQRLRAMTAGRESRVGRDP